MQISLRFAKLKASFFTAGKETPCNEGLLAGWDLSSCSMTCGALYWFVYIRTAVLDYLKASYHPGFDQEDFEDEDDDDPEIKSDPIYTLDLQVNYWLFYPSAI